MKFSGLVALAASAAAGTIQSRQREALSIGEFHADCIPHSSMCSYDFTVTSDPALPANHCSEFLQGFGASNLPNVTEGTCVDNVAYNWSITNKDDGGLDFAIWYAFNSRSNITYCHSIPADELVIEQNGAAQSEHYRGPTSFESSFLNCPTV
ncbi:hypothetical protein V496_06407 [Pseudogymnoascus sp. VKM F-4515 (FW-2607)]|nr:hypothetical protein V496_06407 [Pseudogymnoascus sp. VKM F-4515 (FW-2607)]